MDTQRFQLANQQQQCKQPCWKREKQKNLIDEIVKKENRFIYNRVGLDFVSYPREFALF